MELSRHYYSNGWVRTGNASHATTGLGGKASSLAKSLTGQTLKPLANPSTAFCSLRLAEKARTQQDVCVPAIHWMNGIGRRKRIGPPGQRPTHDNVRSPQVADRHRSCTCSDCSRSHAARLRVRGARTGRKRMCMRRARNTQISSGLTAASHGRPPRGQWQKCFRRPAVPDACAPGGRPPRRARANRRKAPAVV